MQLYSQLQVLSTKLIKQFGVPCTVITLEMAIMIRQQALCRQLKLKSQLIVCLIILPMIS